METTGETGILRQKELSTPTQVTCSTSKTLQIIDFVVVVVVVVGRLVLPVPERLQI